MIDETESAPDLATVEPKKPVAQSIKATYVFRTEPFEHQRKIFRESATKAAVSLFLQPGLGKSKIIIDKASFLYQQEMIDTLLIVAPNGVHRMWLSDEIPIHMPQVVLESMRGFIWTSAKVTTKTAEREREALLKHQGLAVLVVAYESTITKAFKTFAKRLLTKRRAMMVLDESHRIKSATSKVKTTVVAMGAYAPYRRILTGTPIEIPPDLYSQLRFLDPLFWKNKGLPTKAEFDNLFCVTVNRSFGPRSFKQIVGYKNIDLLAKWTAETGYIMSLEDAGITLPPVTYSKHYHEMLPEQRRIYNELRDESRTLLTNGDELVAEAAITRLLRLQQIICGYVSLEAEQPIQRIDPNRNTRLEVAVDEILKDLTTQAIIWARFTEDISQLCDALGNKAVRYDGQVDSDGRALAKKRFQSGDAQYIVMSDAGAEGLTLVGSKTMLVYSNNFALIKRIQKEARQSRIGQKDHTRVIDMVCQDTVDEYIIDALRNKFDIASQLVSSKLKQWI